MGELLFPAQGESPLLAQSLAEPAQIAVNSSENETGTASSS
jgi:hypothetical protein